MPVEKLPVFCLENRVVDQILSSSNAAIFLAVYVFFARFEQATVEEISEKLEIPIIAVKVAIIELKKLNAVKDN